MSKVPAALDAIADRVFQSRPPERAKPRTKRAGVSGKPKMKTGQAVKPSSRSSQ